jgi:hypothetical protein
VPAKQKSSKKFSSHFVLHHLIEFELLIANIYFLAAANTLFRSKITKYWEGVVFSKKAHFFENVENFPLSSCFTLLKTIFSDST